MGKFDLPNKLFKILLSVLISWGIVSIVFDSIFIYERPKFTSLIEVTCALLLAFGVAIIYNHYEKSFHSRINANDRNKLLGFFLLLLIFIISTIVYIFSLSIVSLSIVYTFFFVRTTIYIYTIKINNLNKKSLIVLIVYIFISLYLGNYLAYVREIYFQFINEGYKPIHIILNYYSLINKIELDAMPFVYVLTFLLHSIGIFANHQFIKENLQNENNHLSIIKEELNIKEKDKPQHLFVLKKVIILLTVGALSICAGLQTEHVNDLIANQKVLRSLDTELQTLKLKNNDAYNKAVETFDGYIKNYNYQADVNYHKIDSYLSCTIRIFASLDSDDYQLTINVEDYGTNLSYEWGEWQNHNGKKSYIELFIDVHGEGYAVITISNNINNDVIPVFIDNCTNTK